MSCVIDASMALSFVLADEFGTASERTLRTITERGAVAPSLWDYEVLNGLRSAERRGRLTPAALAAAAHGLARLPITIDSHRPDGLRIMDVAREYQLSAYDAAYLALAMDTGLPLATLDDSLATAATKAGVRLVGA